VPGGAVAAVHPVPVPHHVGARRDGDRDRPDCRAFQARLRLLPHLPRHEGPAAQASGVPPLKLKLIATTLSGALMGMAGAPFPYYIGYLQPPSAFALDYAVNSIALPMTGGTTSWVGPLIGAILLGQ